MVMRVEDPGPPLPDKGTQETAVRLFRICARSTPAYTASERARRRVLA